MNFLDNEVEEVGEILNANNLIVERVKKDEVPRPYGFYQDLTDY